MWKELPHSLALIWAVALVTMMNIVPLNLSRGMSPDAHPAIIGLSIVVAFFLDVIAILFALAFYFSRYENFDDDEGC